MAEIQEEVEELGLQKNVFPCEKRQHVGSQNQQQWATKRVWESTSVLSAGPAETIWRTDAELSRLSISEVLNPFLPLCAVCVSCVKLWLDQCWNTSANQLFWPWEWKVHKRPHNEKNSEQWRISRDSIRHFFKNSSEINLFTAAGQKEKIQIFQKSCWENTHTCRMKKANVFTDASSCTSCHCRRDNFPSERRITDVLLMKCLWCQPP